MNHNEKTFQSMSIITRRLSYRKNATKLSLHCIQSWNQLSAKTEYNKKTNSKPRKVAELFLQTRQGSIKTPVLNSKKGYSFDFASTHVFSTPVIFNFWSVFHSKPYLHRRPARRHWSQKMWKFLAHLLIYAKRLPHPAPYPNAHTKI